MAVSPSSVGLTAALLLVTGCSDSGMGTAPQCAGPVTLSVGGGTNPAFRWTPDCRLFLVLVEDPLNGEDQWGVESDSANGIGPPVTYGTVPAGATKELMSPTALQAGHAYRVDVFRFTGPGHEDGVIVGQQTFTP